MIDITLIPRPIRNNNPGDLETASSHEFDGQTGRDAEGFAVFPNPVLGCRALLLDLNNAMLGDHLVQLNTIIPKYAPPTENDTQLYIRSVATRMGVSRMQSLSPAVDLMPLAQAIAAQEAGTDWFAPICWITARKMLIQSGQWLDPPHRSTNITQKV